MFYNKKFSKKDIHQIINLFIQTVWNINSKDYSRKQLEKWAPQEYDKYDVNEWIKRFSESKCFIVKKGKDIIGFGNVKQGGFLDMLYIHKDFIRKGIGKLILNAIEEQAMKDDVNILRTDASITARPFFERMGWKVVKKQIIIKNKTQFINYKMKKELLKT
ncbi:MAG: GNAT family N-acetyltransferase [bacterium]|nr:GNAT family N-acetyltransferase [bacterium]